MTSSIIFFQDPPAEEDDIFITLDYEDVIPPDWLTDQFGMHLTRVSDQARCQLGNYDVKGYDDDWEGYCYFAKVQKGKLGLI